MKDACSWPLAGALLVLCPSRAYSSHRLSRWFWLRRKRIMPDNKEHRVDKETNVWRKIEKILGTPSHRIAWKFEEAGKIEALIDFKRFCIENWAVEKKVDISKYDNQKITEDEINQIMINAINDGKIEEGREEFSVDKIQDCIENRLNIIFYGCVNPQNNQRITVGKNTLLNVRSMVFFNEL